LRQSSIDTQPSVHRYLRRRVGERLAEELTAETITRAFRARQQFDISHASALPWLYGIAVNLVMMHLRSEHRRERAYRLFDETPIQPSSTTEAAERLDANARGSVLKEALAALSPDQREVLLLHAWAGSRTPRSPKRSPFKRHRPQTPSPRPHEGRRTTLARVFACPPLPCWSPA